MLPSISGSALPCVTAAVDFLLTSSRFEHEGLGTSQLFEKNQNNLVSELQSLAIPSSDILMFQVRLEHQSDRQPTCIFASSA